MRGSPLKMLLLLGAGGLGLTAYQDPEMINQLTNSAEVTQVMDAIRPYVDDMRTAIDEITKQANDLMK